MSTLDSDGTDVVGLESSEKTTGSQALPSKRVEGKARLGRITKQLAPTLRRGDIAVIDHDDIDRLSAQSLVDSGVSAVVNAGTSFTGKFPNTAPSLILEAGIPIVDGVGEAVFDTLSDGDLIEVAGSEVYRNGELVAIGSLLSTDTLDAEMESAHDKMDYNLDDFARNTAEYLKRDGAKIIFDNQAPDIDVAIEGKQVLVVVRGPDYREDLLALRSYIGEMKPVILAVDGAADTLMEMSVHPDVIIGDMDSVSDEALKSGATLIAHAYENGMCPSAARLDALGLDYITWPLAATSEDLALLLAWERGADLIVAVGTHSNLVEYMEKNRRGMASTFLVRLRVGTKLVDAKGVSKLYRPSPPVRYVFVVILAALAAILAAVFISETLRNTLAVMWLTLRTHLGF